MCMHCLHHIHPPTPFPASSSLPLVPLHPKKPVPPRVLWFCRRKNIKDQRETWRFASLT
jgi:hypothetical protein